MRRGLRARRMVIEITCSLGLQPSVESSDRPMIKLKKDRNVCGKDRAIIPQGLDVRSECQQGRKATKAEVDVGQLRNC